MFIVFEGCEGSGKTSALNKVAEMLKANGYDVLVTREPGGTKIAEQIRSVILDNNNIEMDGITEALLYAASRRQHLKEKVIPALKENKIVICDRFIDSSLAYQGYARGLGIENVYNINLFAIDGLLPDLTIFFDIHPNISLARIKANNREQNRLDKEKIEFHNKVYDGYKKIQTMYANRKFANIDATKNQDEVASDVYNVIEEMIK